MSDNNNFLWSVTFILFFGFLLITYGLSLPLFNVNFERLAEAPAAPESSGIWGVPLLGQAAYAGYLFYFTIDKVYIFVDFIFGITSYGNELTLGVPIISVIMLIVTVSIVYEGISFIRGR